MTIPTGLEGTHYLIAKADADNTVVEINEGNNTAVSQALVVGGALWDLVAWLELPSGATAVMPGGTISVVDTTKAENVAAPASTTGIYLSPDATLEAGDVRLGSRAVPALGAGVTHSGTTGVTIPAGTAAGAYYILVKADADNLVLELNEGNNFVPPARAITVGTDMIIGLDVPASAGTILGGSTVPVTDVTRNNRALAVPASTTRFYLSSNPVLDAGDVLVGSRAIPALGPDTESTGTTGVTIPTGLTGTHYLLAKADADNTVVEVDEGNNTAVSQPLIIGTDLLAWLELPSGATAVMPGGTISVVDYTKAENVAAAGVDDGDLPVGQRDAGGGGRPAGEPGGAGPGGGGDALGDDRGDDPGGDGGGRVLHPGEGGRGQPHPRGERGEQLRAAGAGDHGRDGHDHRAGRAGVGGHDPGRGDGAGDGRDAEQPRGGGAGVDDAILPLEQPGAGRGGRARRQPGDPGAGAGHGEHGDDRGDDSDGAQGDVLPPRQGGRGQHGGGDRRGQQHRGVAAPRHRRALTSWRGWSCRAGRRR